MFGFQLQDDQKVSESERCGNPHHLLGIIDNPGYNFIAEEFCKHALEAIDLINQNGYLPIIIGGSNSYLEALVEDPNIGFHSKYDCCFLWLHVSMPVLFEYLDKRVDDMVDAGFVDEIREAFVPGADYSNGIRRAIGVVEFEQFILAEKEFLEANQHHGGGSNKEEMLQDALRRTKENTLKLAKSQFNKICRLNDELGWGMNIIDLTDIFVAVLRGEDHMPLYNELVLKPSMDIVQGFLGGEAQDRDDVEMENK